MRFYPFSEKNKGRRFGFNRLKTRFLRGTAHRSKRATQLSSKEIPTSSNIAWYDCLSRERPLKSVVGRFLPFWTCNGTSSPLVSRTHPAIPHPNISALRTLLGSRTLKRWIGGRDLEGPNGPYTSLHRSLTSCVHTILRPHLS